MWRMLGQREGYHLLRQSNKDRLGCAQVSCCKYKLKPQALACEVSVWGREERNGQGKGGLGKEQGKEG